MKIMPSWIFGVLGSFICGAKIFRSFLPLPAVQILEWLRLPGDLIFIVGGILPVVYLAVRAFLNRNRFVRLPEGEPADSFVQTL